MRFIVSPLENSSLTHPHEIRRCAIDSLDLVVCSPNRARQISRHALLHTCYIVSNTFFLIFRKIVGDEREMRSKFFFIIRFQHFFMRLKNFDETSKTFTIFGEIKILKI